MKNSNLEAGIQSSTKVRVHLNKILGICLMLILVGGLSACKELIEAPGIITAMALLGFPLSSPAARLHKFGTTLRPFANSPSQTNPMLAPFFGNLSTVLLPSTASALDFFALDRETDCSLTFLDWTITNSGGAVTVGLTSQTPNYERTIHNNAFLVTTPNKFPRGCADTAGNTSRLMGVLGGGKDLREHLATPGTGGVLTSSVMEIGAFTTPTKQVTNFSPLSVVGADFNHDGNPDVVSVNSNGSQSSISVLLGKDDGTYQPAVNLALPGSAAQYAVIDDVNGDGILDIVASSSGPNFAFSVFLGNGDGTFKAAQTVIPAGNTLSSSNAFITADVNGDGKKDIVAANGQVFLGGGDGISFTLVAQPAFPSGSTGTSNYAPTIVAADFTNDGKLDLATNDGLTIRTFKGNGDGTFTTGPAYATIGDYGFMVATDLDGDGNIDIWCGYGANGYFGGSAINVAYALMGNGDGTFQGAPILPVKYVGTNLADLNSDGRPDLVGLVQGATQSTFSTFLTQKNGIPAVGPQLPVPAGVTVDSYAVGDLTGDQIPDLVFVSAAPQIQSFYVAIGKGNGGFQTPTATPTPSLVPSGEDVNESITGVRLADINHDGKLDLIYSFSDQDGQSQMFFEGFAVQLGNSNGTFGAPIITTTYASLTAPIFFPSNMLSAVVDVTGDNFPDVFMVLPTVITNGTAQHETRVFVGKGDGTFKPPNTLTLTGNIRASTPDGVNGSPFAVGDLNGDGKVDLVVAGSSADGTMPELAIALGNGDGTFQAPNILTLEGFGFVSGPAIEDFDGDGKLDVFANVPIEGFAAIFPGNGDGTLRTVLNADGTVSGAQAILLSVAGGAVAADLDGDGKPDLIVGNAVLFNKNGSVVPPTAATATVVTSSLNPSTSGTSVTFTATVTSATPGTITGTATFFDGSTSLGNGTLNGAGVATFMTSSLATGSHSITAQYGGDANFANSTSPALSQVVNAGSKAATTTVLTSTVNPSVFGGTVGFMVTVTSNTAGNFTGTVTYFDGATMLGTSAIQVNGMANFFTNPPLSVGTHIITAQYSGDANFAASTSAAVTQTVTAAQLTATTTTLTGPATGTAGASVSFMASVTPSSGTKVPTGMVKFFDGATNVGTGTLNGSGSTTFSTTTLSTGTHSITAQYAGDTNFATSTSTAVSTNITAAGSYTLSVAPSSVTVTAAQPGMATVTVTPVNGFNQQVQFSCTGAPEGIDCEFEPHSVTPNGGPVTTMLAVTEEAEGDARARKSGAVGGAEFRNGDSGKFVWPTRGIFVPVLGCELLVLAGIWRRRKVANAGAGLQVAFTAMLLLTIGTFIGGCSGGGHGHNVGGTITIVGTGPNNQTVTVPITVTIQR